MRLLLCSDPLSPRLPDSAFRDELDAIESVGLDFDLLDLEALLAGESSRAIRRLSSPSVGMLVYRGWMMDVASYENLARALASVDGSLINDPAAYRLAHHLPSAYAALEGSTPRTVWVDGGAPFDMGQIHSVLRAFGDGPVIVKDFVKSRKHEWEEACFIPAADDRAAVERVVGTFVERQGKDLAGGLVLREFVQLEQVGRHPRSGLELGREYRLFYLDGRLLIGGRYWEDADYSADFPTEPFAVLAGKIASRFISMDIAKTADGNWIVIEVGDGQVSGLQTIDGRDFYGLLATRLAEHQPATTP